MKRNFRIAVSISTIVYLFLVPLISLDVIAETPYTQTSITSATSIGDEIVISHNDNFTTQGWPGNGTSENPFLISSLDISSDQTCINITNTNLFFVIENCYLTSEGIAPNGMAIYLQSVQNGEFRNVFITKKATGIHAVDTSHISFFNVTIYDTNRGIHLRDSSDSTINSSIIQGCSAGPAISIDNSDHCDIVGNRLVGNPVGLLSNSSDWITATNNTIVGNSNYGIQSTSGTKKLAAYWNKIGWNGQNAIDDGNTKFWDHEGVGNWWSDSENDTDYIVSGTAKAKDRFPRIWIDDIAPSINTQVIPSESDGIYSIFISAEVQDNVAVNQVILSYSLDNMSTWTNTTMNWIYSTWTTNIENLSAGSEIHYMVYAADYADNWAVTTDEMYSIPLDIGPFGNESGTDTLLLVGIAGILAVVIVAAALMYRNPSRFGWRN